MTRFIAPLLTLPLLLSVPVGAQQQETYDYWQGQREMVQRGQQAIFTCNGLFTSNRALQEIFAQELPYLRKPVGTAQGGDYAVDWNRRAVAIGAAGGAVPVMRAAFRKGIGCVILAPDQTFADIDDLPELDMPLPPGDPAKILWPDGDRIETKRLPATVNAAALQAASDWAFERESPEQVTVSLVVVYDGEIIHERYAPGFDATTRTRTWSTAKSIAVTLVGMLGGRRTVGARRAARLRVVPQCWLPGDRSAQCHHAPARAEHVERLAYRGQCRSRVRYRLGSRLLGRC